MDTIMKSICVYVIAALCFNEVHWDLTQNDWTSLDLYLYFLYAYLMWVALWITLFSFFAGLLWDK